MFFRRLLKPVAPTPQHNPVTLTTEENTRASRVDILARTIWGEARGESLTGKEAVAHVILNRLSLAQKRGNFWWGNTIESICRKPFQFSCWNKDDPNYQKLLRITEQDADFVLCQRIAHRALNGLLNDPTYGADHYHNTKVNPSWARPSAITATIGNHLFYKLEF